MTLFETLILGSYFFVLVILGLYGWHRYYLVYSYMKNKDRAPGPPPAWDGPLPPVTIQLPLYNEMYVADRLLQATARIEYPKELLEIQILDDSTDETSEVARLAADRLVEQGFDVKFMHRTNRSGFKAGALEAGLKVARGEFVAIFDADFIPTADFLQRTVPYFQDPKLALVQARWGHVNADYSVLTKVQAILLDAHFVLEHGGRNRAGHFFNFNGTAGIWRRKVIPEAGGWQHDTLTEDLDLSYRAQMRGWKFVFLRDVTAPAELPPEMRAFKAQQFRWTKGGAQVALKLLPKVLLSKAPLKVKVEAFFHLTCFMLHLFMLGLVLMIYPAMYLQSVPLESGTVWRGMFDLGIFTLATLSASVFYVASQYVLFQDWRTAVKYLPVLMAIGVGLCVSNTKAILEALLGKSSEFVRTPKYGDGTLALNGPGYVRKRKRDFLPYIEFALGLYMAACAVLSMLDTKSFMAAPFLVIFSFGFFYVSVLSFQAQRACRLAAQAQSEAVKAKA